MGRLLKYELYPLSITVHGDVAIAHYLYSSAFKSKKGDIEMSNGRYTDTLVRTEDGWKFIAWHGGKVD
jgi:ketosteroid isomerase-like protein